MATKCPKCHAENPDTKQFCGDCGTSLHSSKDIGVTKTIETPVEEYPRGSTFAGRYKIIEKLGKGGMGAVYRVEDKKIGQDIALKLIKPDIASDKKTIERFRNELKTTRMISHRNVCRMFDIGDAEGTHFITMEYVPGEDLKSFIRRSGKLDIPKAISIAKEVCEGLSEAHRLGVVHRDLKSSNIMIDKDGNARIMDFGIARSLAAKGLTGEGIVIGTPEYMSPEQAEAKDVDHRSDIYSLGVILYEMVTGQLPFKGDTPLSIAMKHKGETAKNPKRLNPNIPDDLSAVILRCLEKDTVTRYQTASEVRSELEKIEKGIPTMDRELPKGKPLTSKEITVTFGLKKLLVPVPIFIAVVIIGVIIWQLLPEKESAIPSKKGMLAVLPFENLGSPEDEYFADGITDEIIARLTNVADLRVIARGSAIQYKDTNKSINEIGEELGVEYILSGTIRWQKSLEEPGHVRVTPSLIRVANSTQIWAEVYDELITEVFKVQSDISKKVIDALGAALLEPEKKELEARPTQNMEAYEYYLRGNDYYYQGADERYNRMSIENYEKAVDLDQSFYQAYARLARAQARNYWLHYDHSPERAVRAKEAAEQASLINSEAPDTQMALGYYYYHCELNYDEALKHFALALKKQPQNSEVLEGIGTVKRRQGKMEEALTNFKKATEFDPRAANLAFNVANTYVLLRNFQEAERWYDRSIFLNPDYQRAHFHRVRLNIYQGDTERARQILEEISRSLDSLDPHRIIYCWVLVDIFEGKYEDALKHLSSVSIEAFSDQFYFVPKSLLNAQIYGFMENAQLEKLHYERALKFLEEKIKEEPHDSRYYSALGITYAGLSRKEEAIQAAEKAVKILPTSKEIYRGAFRVQDLAQVYAMAGEYDRAIDQIEYLLSIPSEICEGLYRVDPIWNPLKEHSRFKKLIMKVQKN